MKLTDKTEISPLGIVKWKGQVTKEDALVEAGAYFNLHRDLSTKGGQSRWMRASSILEASGVSGLGVDELISEYVDPDNFCDEDIDRLKEDIRILKEYSPEVMDLIGESLTVSHLQKGLAFKMPKDPVAAGEWRSKREEIIYEAAAGKKSCQWVTDKMREMSGRVSGIPRKPTKKQLRDSFTDLAKDFFQSTDEAEQKDLRLKAMSLLDQLEESGKRAEVVEAA